MSGISVLIFNLEKPIKAEQLISWAETEKLNLAKESENSYKVTKLDPENPLNSGTIVIDLDVKIQNDEIVTSQDWNTVKDLLPKIIQNVDIFGYSTSDKSNDLIMSLLHSLKSNYYIYNGSIDFLNSTFFDAKDIIEAPDSKFFLLSKSVLDHQVKNNLDCFFGCD